MEKYKIRMINEASELSDKIEVLSTFINLSPQYLLCSEVKQHLLKQQLSAMKEYLNILCAILKEEGIQW